MTLYHIGVPEELILTGVRFALGLLETGAVSFLVTLAFGIVHTFINYCLGKTPATGTYLV